MTNRSLFWAIAFFSGCASLIYEVLWFREFALLLGNTAQASAIVFSTIFMGLAIGNTLGGRWAKDLSCPLRTYALVELLTAFCSIAVVLFKRAEGGLEGLPLFFSLFVVAIFMGASLPLLLQSLPGDNHQLRHNTPILYGINTFGGMIGAGCAGLFLPVWLGVEGSFIAAIAMNLILAAFCLRMSFFIQSKQEKSPENLCDLDSEQVLRRGRLRSQHLMMLAGFSGLGTLALEVLWTRMFSLVLQNSVYGFSLILVLILFALSVAALIVDVLIKRGEDPLLLMRTCLLVVAISIPLGAWFFVQTSGLQTLFNEMGPLAYIIRMLSIITILLLPTMIAAGMILPLSWTIDQQSTEAASMRLGRLMTFNTLGAVVGSLATGFFLLPILGLWSALGMVSLCYALAAIFFTIDLSLPSRTRRTSILKTASMLLPALLLFPSFPTQHLKPGESLLHLDQGTGSQVAVIQKQNGSRVLKVNNTYSLGSSAAEIEERRMGQIPLLLHPAPNSVAFVGVATGITASAIFDHPVETVKLIELLPEVVKAAAWFENENRGLLTDPRSEVVIADGRIAIPEGGPLFDLIISDLFVPWHAGATSLYSLDYYQEAEKQLSSGGIYAQWLPLYQMSEAEFKIIGRTFSSVFSHVSLWRGNFSAQYPVIVLIGSDQPILIDRVSVEKRLKVINEGAGTNDPALASVDDLLLFFGGEDKNLEMLFSEAKVNTDNHPYIEYLSPISRITKNQLRGQGLANLFLSLVDDSHEWQNYALSGAYLYQAEVATDIGDLDQRIAALNRVDDLVSSSHRGSQDQRSLRVSGFLNH